MSTAITNGIQNKLLSTAEVSFIMRRYSPDCASDAACILSVEKEFRRFYLNSDLSLNVFIAGPTCSGKTTLAKRMDLYFKSIGITVTTIHQDDYYKNLKQIPRCSGGYYMDGLDAFRVEEFSRDFQKLITEGRVRVPYYDIRYNKRTGHRTPIKKSRINIVEGLHVVEIFKNDPNSIYFYMNVPISTCLERRISRDTKVVGVSEERVKEYFAECIMPMYNRDILPQYYIRNIGKYYRYIDEAPGNKG